MQELQFIQGSVYFRVFGLPSDFKEGVIFSTYATLVSSVSRGKNKISKHVLVLLNYLDRVIGFNTQLKDQCFSPALGRQRCNLQCGSSNIFKTLASVRA